MKEKMIEIVQKQLTAYNEKNLIQFSECYHEDIECYRINNSPICKGKKSFNSMYENLFLTSPLLRCEVKSRIVLDEFVIDEEFVTGRSNKTDILHVAVIYGFRDGFIEKVWFVKK